MSDEVSCFPCSKSYGYVYALFGGGAMSTGCHWLAASCRKFFTNMVKSGRAMNSASRSGEGESL